MAARTSCARNLLADWRRRAFGVGLILLGLGGVWLGVDTFIEFWSNNQSFQTSTDAQTLARQAAEPIPVWLARATPDAVRTDLAAVPPPLASAVDAPTFDVTPAETRTAPVDQLSLDSTDFRFLDPPEPGAHARVAVTIANHADVPSGRVLLGIPATWFDSYNIIGTAPAVSQDRTDDNGLRTFSFPPVGPNSTVTYELHVTAAVEGTTAPDVKVVLDSGDSIGEATPTTQAPPPNPGPVMALNIPRLSMHTGVLQVDWEAPPFTVGQIKRTAHITQGNTVLIGHLTGAAGNIFAHLDQLHLGDHVTAVSRGVSYQFVVSRIFTSSNTDTKPIDPTSDSQLTLMTCTGVWNPFTRDYSERLWVIAQPPDEAADAIAKAQATATAEATAAALATPTVLEAEPTATPVPTPTPFVGEPSAPGGLGNTSADFARTLGNPAGQTEGKMVVFRQPQREYHVLFAPDSQRSAMLVEIPSKDVRLTLDVAMQDARHFLPSDATPRSGGPEGNPQFVVERFSSARLSAALGTGDVSVLYTRGTANSIASVVIGLGDDFGALLEQAHK